MKRKKLKKIVSYLSLIYVFVYSIFGILFYFEIIDNLFLTSAFYAAILNISNFLIIILLYYYSTEKSNSKFLIYNLGGMGARLLILLFTVFIFLKFLKIDKYAFIFTFFIFYFLQLIFEIGYFVKRAKNTGND